MAVIVDGESFASETVQNVGQILDAVRERGRMVVRILIDGQEPDLGDMIAVRGEGLAGRTVFIETAVPAELAREAIEGLKGSLEDIDALRLKAIAHLDENQPQLAIQSLAALFTTWHTAQLCVTRVAELAHLRLDTIRVGDKDAEALLIGFGTILREIRNALQNRDYVLLGDMLRYDLENAEDTWKSIVAAVSATPWVKAA